MGSHLNIIGRKVVPLHFGWSLMRLRYGVHLKYCLIMSWVIGHVVYFEKVSLVLLVVDCIFHPIVGDVTVLGAMLDGLGLLRYLKAIEG